jgi:alcohol dehydrogenase
MGPFELQLRTRVLFGQGRFEELGTVARELGFRRTLLVADQGLVAAGYVSRAVEFLADVGVESYAFHDFDANPDTTMVEAGRVFAEAHSIDSMVGLGGGSSLDCAKGINFVFTNGGTMRNYAGYGRAVKPLLPMIAVPTTAGTGSEAQSYALISDAETHVKMACGDPKAAFQLAILDPVLTRSQPRHVTAISGYDAISHAVESYVSSRRNAVSQIFARDAWQLLAANYEQVLNDPGDLEARGAMQLGAHLSGIAIEHSMLGATHACANPLTAQYGITHGSAIAALLAHVVRWNQPAAGQLYRELDHDDLSQRLVRMAEAGDLFVRLREQGVSREALPALAEEAAAQWTGWFNPRPFDASGAMEIYEWAY